MQNKLIWIFFVYTIILAIINVISSLRGVGIWGITISNVIGILIYYIILKILINRNLSEFGYSEQKKWADTIYFLGFMMTLVALIVVFNQAYYNSGGALVALNLIQSAIALSSTAVAIFLRQFWVLSIKEEQHDFSSLRRDIEEFHSSLRSIKQATSDHLSFLKQSNLEFDSAMRQQVENTSAHLLKISETHAESLATVDEQLRQLGDDYRQSILSETAKHRRRRGVFQRFWSWVRSKLWWR